MSFAQFILPIIASILPNEQKYLDQDIIKQSKHDDNQSIEYDNSGEHQTVLRKYDDSSRFLQFVKHSSHRSHKSHSSHSSGTSSHRSHSSHSSGTSSGGTYSGAHGGTSTTKTTTTPTVTVKVTLSSGTPTITEIPLSWTTTGLTSSEIQSVDIYQNEKLIKNVSSSSYTVASLTQNTTYTYYIKVKTSTNVYTSNTITVKTKLDS